jgi:hypothetical protein
MSQGPSNKVEEDAPTGWISDRPMSFRLPTPLGQLLPAASEQMSFTKIWRGVLLLEGVMLSDGSSQHELYVSAAQTDGERCVLLFIRTVIASYLRMPSQPF